MASTESAFNAATGEKKPLLGGGSGEVTTVPGLSNSNDANANPKRPDGTRSQPMRRLGSKTQMRWTTALDRIQKISPRTRKNIFTEITKVETVKDNPMKLVRYDPEELTGLRAFGHISTSMFTSKSVWRNMLCIMAAALSVACFVFLTSPDPTTIDPGKLRDAASFFKVFIAFMLGLYVSAAYGRYTVLIQELTALFACVKQTQTELINLGVDRNLRKTIERYALVSCRLLHVEMMWVFEPFDQKKMNDWREKFAEFEEAGYLYNDECKTLLDAIAKSGG